MLASVHPFEIPPKQGKLGRGTRLLEWDLWIAPTNPCPLATSPCSLSSRARTSVRVEGPALKTFCGSPLLQQGEAGLQSSGRAFPSSNGLQPRDFSTRALKRAIKTRTFFPRINAGAPTNSYAFPGNEVVEIESEWTARDRRLKMSGGPARTFLCPG